MNPFGMPILLAGILGCSEKEPQTAPSPTDSGIVVGPPPEPASTDSAEEDTGLTEEPEEEDTAIADSDTEDSGELEEEDSAVTDSGTEDTAVEYLQMSDFSLPDVNPYSPTLGTTITVRDQLQKISGWYFIKAT